MRAGIIIQARLQSKRFPNKVLYPSHGKTIIEHVIDECLRTELPVVVAIPQNKSEAGLKYFIEKMYGDKVSVVEGHNEDLMLRYIKASKEMDIDPIIRVCGDSPMILSQDITLALNTFYIRGYYTRFNQVEVFGQDELIWYEKNTPFIEQRQHCLGVVGLSTIDYPEDIERVEREVLESPTYKRRIKCWKNNK